MLQFARADNRSRNSGLLQHPRQSYLRIAHAARRGYFRDVLHHREILRTVILALRVVVGFRTHRVAPVFLPPVARHEPARQRTERNHADALGPAERQHLPLFFAIDQIEVVLHAHEAGHAQLVGRGQHLHELPREHCRRSDVADLPRPDQIVQRNQRFFNRRLVVEPVDLVEIHEIRAEAFEAGVDGMKDMFSRQPLVVRIVAHRIKDLRGNHHAVAAQREIPDCPPRDLLAHPVRVHVRGVEEVDPQIRRPPKERLGFLFVQHPLTPLFRAICHGSETDPRYFQSGRSEPSVFHGDLTPPAGTVRSWESIPPELPSRRS